MFVDGDEIDLLSEAGAAFAYMLRLVASSTFPVVI